jgi:hypothetical protein
MSATLTWASSGLGAKTGTTNATLITDLVTLINSKLADATFAWQVASSSTAGPLYIVLKPKGGAAGRILLVIWATAPAGNNAEILDTTPSTSALYCAYFPAGNVDTPSNLAASSGTILGNNTDAVKVCGGLAITTIYAANVQPFYCDSAEAVMFGFQNPASASCNAIAAGNIVVNAADNAYGATMSLLASTFGSNSASPMPWLGTAILAGSTTPHLRTNFGAANRAYFCAFIPSGLWANQAVGAADVLTNTATSQFAAFPCPLLGQTKLEGLAIKLRQIAFGPGATGAFAAYNTTGPVVAARQFNAATAGGNGFPWLTNYKL